MPMELTTLFTYHNVERWIHVGLADRPNTTRATYRARMEVILRYLASEGDTPAPRIRIDQDDPGLPLSHQQQADLWLWARSLPSPLQRGRMCAAVVLGLGCGLTKSEEGHVYREDVTRDFAGVHIRVRDGRNGIDRVVTCHERWERRLWELAKEVPAGHLFASPWRDTPQTKNAYSQMMAATKRTHTPPVEWSHQRTRTTWIATHLQQGTPLPTLLHAAGLSSTQSIDRLLPYLPPANERETAQQLRGIR